MRFLSVFLLILSLLSLFLFSSLVDAGVVTVYGADGCSGTENKTPFSETDYCFPFGNGGSARFRCFDPTNANPPLNDTKLWPKIAQVLMSTYTAPGCPASAITPRLFSIHPNACLNRVKVQCDQYTSQLPDNPINWYGGDIGVSLSATQQMNQCPASQSLFENVPLQYARSIAPLNECMPNLNNENGNLATKVTCTPGLNATTDPAVLTVVEYTDRSCSSVLKTRIYNTGCGPDEAGTVSRYQCKINGVYTNDNYVYTPSSAYGNNYWNPLVVVGSALMGLFLLYANY